MEAGNDNELVTFFEELKKHVREIDNEDAKECIEQVEGIKEKYRQQLEKVKLIKENLKNQLGEKLVFRWNDLVPVFKDPAKNDEVEYIDKEIGKINFRGEDLSESDIEEGALDRKLNELQNKYRELSEKHTENENLKNGLEKRKSKLKGRLNGIISKIPFLYKLNEKKYNQTEAELKEVQQILEEEKKFKREKERLEILKMLTPEQIELIRDLFETYRQLNDFPVEECFKASCAIADIYGYDPVYYRHSRYGTKYHDRKKYDRALEKMYEDGTASDEIIQKIADKIAKIDEKRNEFKYDNKMYLEEKSKLPHFNGYSEQLEYYSKKELVKEGFKKIVYGLFKELKEATLEADKPSTEVKSAEIADLTIKKEISSSEVSGATALMNGIANKILKYRGEKND